MTINFCDLEGRFWINDQDEVLWFDSPLEAKAAQREIEMREAARCEALSIAKWFRRIGMTQAAMAIEAGDYKRG